MKTPFRSLAAAFAFWATVTLAPAGDIVWVTQFDTQDGQEFIDLIAGNGHTVTKLVATSNTLVFPDQIDQMNAADLVIFSRQIDSGQYNTQNWDTVTAPMIVMSAYVLRAVRWGADVPWFSADTLVDETPDPVVANDPGHPLFTGVPLNGGNSPAWHTAVDRNTTLMGALVSSGGTLLASSGTGNVIAAQWPAMTVASGPRLFLAMGSRELNGAGVATAGKFNLTTVGEQVLLNAVALFSIPDNGNDSDGDGVPDDRDAFPNDPNEWLDTDDDGTGNNADPDDDGDMVDDGEDAFPLDPSESIDTDSDGLGDNADTDDDNDGVADAGDAFPTDAGEWDDDDSDGTGNNADSDDDGDGFDDPRTSKVVWIRQVDTTAGDEFVTLLRDAGHDVQVWIGDSAALTAMAEDFARVFNEADLVILSRTVTSGNFQTDIWDRITAPMIVMTPYVTRPAFWGWFDSDVLAADTPLSVVADQPQHPIFQGITLDAGTTGPWLVAVDRGTSFANAPVVNGGTVLATTDLLYPAAVEWPAGAVAAGPRLLLPMGSWEADGEGVVGSGDFNLTPLGERVLLNAVQYYTPPLSTALPDLRILSAAYDRGLNHFTATFSSRPGSIYFFERSIDLETWVEIEDVTATDSTTTVTDFDPPTDSANYRVRE